MLGNYGSCILYSLTRDAYPFDISQGHIHVKKRALRQSFGQNFPDAEQREASCFCEIKILACHKAYGQPRYTEYRSLQRARYGAGIRRVISQIASVVDA